MYIHGLSIRIKRLVQVTHLCLHNLHIACVCLRYFLDLSISSSVSLAALFSLFAIVQNLKSKQNIPIPESGY